MDRAIYKVDPLEFLDKYGTLPDKALDFTAHGFNDKYKKHFNDPGYIERQKDVLTDYANKGTRYQNSMKAIEVMELSGLATSGQVKEMKANLDELSNFANAKVGEPAEQPTKSADLPTLVNKADVADNAQTRAINKEIIKW